MLLATFRFFRSLGACEMQWRPMRGTEEKHERGATGEDGK